ncbi:endonuclease/exonuclease/phosphatase family protein [Ancylomarina euxinus]|uniref:Endonuclease/exonuclease/phosphatase family protein n=1 Tax=Ancylomarina euxinus TaxID=2283627 RepID=A0A425Y2B5_9BACT|nr:endonuclease/exonuclease/phosphatase family protein [Ancylomarina euxinus]MCZ4694930.1 endonuclease/exonuclease/phosphatase family protein [Ancylomarina euxinus]MUP14796.1 endonuclease/exonuclease/phosphatase family protein [Ancylomarina euxinus]RRG22140.1 endonuclease/exonuclease/phosphatase family protein [Ancylomarina euxinus]
MKHPVKNQLIFLSLLVIMSSLWACQPKQELRVLQFNIWQEGTVVTGGFDAIVEEIVRTDAHLVAFSEVRNYDDSNFNERIIAELELRGLKFYGGKSYDSGLISRYPIESYSALYPVKDDHGSITKARINIDGEIVAFYSAHLDYLNCSYYMPRGYSGNTWEELSEPTTDVVELLSVSQASKRDDAIKVFIADAKEEMSKGSKVIIGGDFNEPSHRDWIAENSDLYDHNGVVIEWECTKLLEEAGFIDTYRERYPDPLKNPGFTYPSYNPLIPIHKLTWAPKSDERERIDFIFYNETSQLKLKEVIIVGPDASIVKSEVYVEAKDLFSKPTDTWPSDHKGILAVFEF